MMENVNFEKLLIPGEFVLKLLLWVIDMTPSMLDEPTRFFIALGLSVIVWIWGFRIVLELIKKALGIGPYYRGGGQ